MLRLWEGIRYRLLEAYKNAYWSIYYYFLDNGYVVPARPVDERILRHYCSGLERHPAVGLIREAKRISMLHEEVLLVLYHLASVSHGRVLEIGTYVGGSTVIMAKAAGLHQRLPVISVEPGGAANHPTIPSADIFGDLQRNLVRFDCERLVHLHHGYSDNPRVMSDIAGEVEPGGLSVLAIDADGHVERDVENYRSLLRDGTVLVLDDYLAPGAPEKQLLVKAWVDDAVERGEVKSFGLWGWGTWIGVYRGPTQSAKVAAVPQS